MLWDKEEKTAYFRCGLYLAAYFAAVILVLVIALPAVAAEVTVEPEDDVFGFTITGSATTSSYIDLEGPSGFVYLSNYIVDNSERVFCQVWQENWYCVLDLIVEGREVEFRTEEFPSLQDAMLDAYEYIEKVNNRG